MHEVGTAGDLTRALLQAVADHLVLVPRDERRVDGHQAELAPERAGVEERRLAEPEDRDVYHRLRFGEASILEVGDGDRVIALALGFERVADESARDAEFGDRVGRRRRWRSRVEGAGELGVEDRLL